MTLPVFRRFIPSDIPNAPNWMQIILTPLNIFCEQVVATLNKNLVIGENVQGQKYSTSFTTPAGYATGDFQRLSFNYTGGGQPTCITLGSITRDDGTLILSPVTVTSWSMNINTIPSQVQINYIAGLAASTKYNITFLVL